MHGRAVMLQYVRSIVQWSSKSDCEHYRPLLHAVVVNYSNFLHIRFQKI